jgi:hypothetical protein
MIRKFEHGILCLRANDKYVINVAKSPGSLFTTQHYSLSVANPDNQVFKDHNPLLAPRVLADWTYQ